MTVKAGYCTPMLHVAEIEKSIRFYELLGFNVPAIDYPGYMPSGKLILPIPTATRDRALGKGRAGSVGEANRREEIMRAASGGHAGFRNCVI
jgi:hypothetical protein